MKPAAKQDAYEVLRRRMRRETEVAILYGLRFPDRVASIPKVEVGKGTFSREFSSCFWSETVGLPYPEFISKDRLAQLLQECQTRRRSRRPGSPDSRL